MIRTTNRRIFWGLISLAIVFFLAVYILLGTQKLQLKKVFLICPAENIKGVEMFQNTNLLFLSEKTVTATLLSRNTFLKEVTLEKLYPDAINIHCILRDAIAQIQSANQVLFLDENGIFLPPQSHFPQNLPIIASTQTSMHVSEGDWRIKKAIEFILRMGSSTIQVNRITIDEDMSSFHIQTRDGTLILVKNTSDPRDIAASLQTIIYRFRIEGKFVDRVDFRFDKPIVVLSHGSTESAVR